MTDMDILVRMVDDANPTRSVETIHRRLLKVVEELGETSEAYLSRTSHANYKNKTWLDYREEAVDTLIILLDIALTTFPDTNYPPAALLPQKVSDGKMCSFENTECLELAKFDILRAIGAAEEHLRNGIPLSFYGAIARGVYAASKICFAKIPEDNDVETIGHRVEDLFRLKLDKWLNSLSNSTDEVPEREQAA